MRFITAHLTEVGENYLEHMRHAAGFSCSLLLAAVACLVHALFPFLCVKTGSNAIRRLHDRMVLNRHKLSSHSRDAASRGTSVRTPAA